MDKTLIIVLIGRVIQIFLSLVTVRIYTNFLSTAEVGNLFLINSLVGLFALTMINPVGMYINRKLHKWGDDKTVVNYFFIFNLYLIFVSMLSLIIIIMLNKSFGIGNSINLQLLSLFIMLNVYFSTWNQTIIPSLNMLNYRRSFVIFTLTTLILGLLLSVVFVKTICSSAVWWLSGQLIAQVVMTIVAFVYFKKVTKAVFDLDFTKRVITQANFGYLVTFALPLGITTFFMWVQNQSYRMIIERYIGLEFLGMIGVGMGVAASIAGAVDSLLQQVYSPIFYREINTSDPSKREAAWNKMAQLIIPVYISLTLLVSCLAPYLVKILVNEKFFQAYIYVVYGSWVEMFRLITNTLASVAHSELQTKSLIKAYFAGGLIVSIGVYMSSNTDNYQQVIPMVLVLSGFATMLIMYRDMRKLMRINIGFERIGKSICYALPFTTALFFNSNSLSLRVSMLVITSYGLYFVSSQYLIYKKELTL